MATGLPLGSVPRMPLLVPVSTHRDVTRVPSSVWKVSTGVDVQVIDAIEELLHPVLDVALTRDFLAARLDDNVVGYEPVDGIGLMRVPDVVPEGVNNLR